MMVLRFIIVVLCGLTGLVLPREGMAEPHVLSVGLAEDSVDITTGFNGGDLVLFGVREKGGQVAIVLHGPKRDFVVRRKSQVGGAWVNRHSVKFEQVPVFYDVALSADEATLLPKKTLKEMGVGLASLRFDPADKKLSKADKALFQEALIRNKQAEGLFPAHAQDVEFLSDNFFKATLHVPSNVPVGQYVIETFLIKNQRVVDKRITNVTVGQVGFSAGVYKFAHSYAFVYALLTVVFAVWAGWLSNAVRKRK